MLHISPSIAIPDEEISFDFVRSSGPGGQRVNKVSTCVQLRFNVVNSPSLPDYVKARLLVLAGSRVSNDGVLVIEAQRFASQGRNREDAIKRLVALVLQAAHVPKFRHKTKPTAGSRERRLEQKSRRGLVKRGRGTVID
jgi:ribosome-associated protein